MKIRGTPTDSLADIIQSLQLIRKSGLLTVERDGPGNFSEIGRIAFRDGQIIDAELGQLRGANAFRKLAAWQTCHFLFEPAPSTSLSSLPSLPAGRNGQVSEHSYSNHNNKGRSLNEYSSTSIVPYRSRHAQNTLPDFQRFGLLRIHYQLFLLIDGKRTSQELARLIGRNPQEALALLADLERMSLIGH